MKKKITRISFFSWKNKKNNPNIFFFKNKRQMFSTYLLLWYVILIVVSAMIIAIISTSVSNVSSLWTWWGIGVGCVSAVFLVILLGHVYLSKSKSKKQQNLIQQSNENYTKLAKQAQTDPDCVTERQQCYKEKIQIKRQNEKMNAGKEIEDQAAINACAKKPETNKCVENVLDACETAIRARNDASLLEQFKDFRLKHEASEVLGFCKTATAA